MLKYSMLNNTLSNKTVLITGASSGIGEALAREFSAYGSQLVLAARRTDKLKAITLQCKGGLERTRFSECDVTRDGDMERTVQEGIQAFGKLDIVVANAGFGIVGNVEDMTLEDYRRQFETNIFGVLRTIYASLDELKKTRGTLVLIGSIVGTFSMPGGTPYSMSKFAIHSLAQALYHELKPHGVAVVLIAPGLVESEFRNIDNHGQYHPEKNGEAPRFLVMPTQKAAQKILRAIVRRKPIEVITFHGKGLVWVQRHFPWVLSFLFSRGLKTRSP